MTDTIGGPSGPGVAAESPTASKAPSAGRPSRNDIAAHMSKAESAAKEPASSEDSAPPSDGAPGVEASEANSGDNTGDPLPGKDGKPSKEAQEHGESVPMAAFKERLAREKDKREKLSADLASAQLEQAKLRQLFEVAVAENERLSEALRSGASYDEKGEELQALKVQQRAQELFAKLQGEHEARLRQQAEEQQIEVIKERLRSEVESAVQEFPLVSDAEVKAELRKNPAAEVREIARAIHEKRMALVSQQRAPATAAATPTTVGKTTGASGFQYPLGRRGIADALRASATKG